MRYRNTTRQGTAFSESTVEAVWRKGRIVPGYDEKQYRQDECGAWIERSQYANTASGRGWEIDHIRPVALGGGDELSNLQPLQWANNRSKGDEFPNWTCAVPV